MGSRYSKVVDQVVQREIVLLKGFPCVFGKCSFCNYVEDNTTNEEEIAHVNSEALAQVTGEYGVLEVINSGSVFELPQHSLDMIRDVVRRQHIKVLYLEIYYSYRKRLQEMRDFFEGVELRFRMGLETFDNEFRRRVYNKPFTIAPEDYEAWGKDVFSVCLLMCVKGQTHEMLRRDVELGLKYFRAITINVFVNNGTRVERDEELVAWFVEEYGHLKGDDRVEVLVDNKDLGVFEQ